MSLPNVGTKINNLCGKIQRLNSRTQGLRNPPLEGLFDLSTANVSVAPDPQIGDAGLFVQSFGLFAFLSVSIISPTGIPVPVGPSPIVGSVPDFAIPEHTVSSTFVYDNGAGTFSGIVRLVGNDINIPGITPGVVLLSFDAPAIAAGADFTFNISYSLV